MIKIKESIKPFHKVSATNYGWLSRALNRKDALGRTGMEIFDKHDIEIVHGTDRADVGFSMHGNPVQGVPQKKCILFKGEPPIYNIFFGWNLNKPNFLKKFMAVMSNSEIENFPYIPAFSPQIFYNNEQPYSDIFFDLPKDRLLCMILRPKKWAIRANTFHPSLHKFNKRSLLKKRQQMDREFCKTFGSERYYSFAIKGKWSAPCFHGPVLSHGGVNKEVLSYVPVYDNLYHEMSRYKFNFCPENSSFKGYLTEKPIQAMLCGNIPIYIGAPDVEEILPKGTYIDARWFTAAELRDLITGMDTKTYEKYRGRIEKFITTKESKAFFSVTFAEKIAKILEEKKCI